MVKSLQNKTRKRRRTRKQVGSGNFSSRVSSRVSEARQQIREALLEEEERKKAKAKEKRRLKAIKEGHYRDVKEDIQKTLVILKQNGLPLPGENRRSPSRRKTSGKNSVLE